MLKNIDKWLGSFISQEFKKLLGPKASHKPTHIIFCSVDHYEPDWNGADHNTQIKRVERWVKDFPILVKKYKDSEGHHPKHTFFYPAEVYNKKHLEMLKTFVDQGIGEVEIHLHHDGDTEETLKLKLEKAKTDFASHGFLGRRKLSGKVRFAFIHGNWCLNNSRKDGRWCGVNHESHVLADCGCYADFTFPSAPSDTQPKKINSIYYTSSNPNKPKSHNKGIDAEVGKFTPADLMIIQGPLALNWRTKKIENGDISKNNPPTKERVDLWANQRISVKGRPDWVFIKVHTHGAPEQNADVILGKPMDEMYSYLSSKYNDGTHFLLHYVSAREMYNIIKAAEAGEKGSPGQYRDYIIEKNN